MATSKTSKAKSETKASEAEKGIGARDNTGTTTATSGAKRVGPGADEKTTGQGVSAKTDVTAHGADAAVPQQPTLQSGPGAPGFITPAVAGMGSATFSAGGTPVTTIDGSVTPVIQDDDVPAGQSPVDQGDVPENTEPKSSSK